MATRFYLPSSGAAAVSPSYSSGWEDTTIASRLKCVTTKISSAMTTVSFTDANATNKDVLFRQYVSDPIAAQTISGDVKFQIRVKERDASCNLYTSLNISVVSNDGSVTRGDLVSMSRDDTEASASALTNRGRYITMTSVTAHSGDRIVIEIGMGGDPGTGSDHDSDMSIGDDSATDLGENDTDTSAYNPWVNFDQTITFFTAGDIIVNNITGGRLTPGGSSLTISHISPSGFSNDGLIFLCTTYSDDGSSASDLSGVTFNGDALTAIKKQQGSGDMAYNWAQAWYIDNPDIGTYNLVATVNSGTNTYISGVVVSLANVRSTQADAVSGNVTSGSSSTSVSVTTTVDRCFVFSASGCGIGSSTVTPGTGQYVLYQYGITDAISYSSAKTPAGSVSHTYSGGASSGEGWINVIASIAPYVDTTTTSTSTSTTSSSSSTSTTSSSSSTSTTSSSSSSSTSTTSTSTSTTSSSSSTSTTSSSSSSSTSTTSTSTSSTSSSSSTSTTSTSTSSTSSSSSTSTTSSSSSSSTSSTSSSSSTSTTSTSTTSTSSSSSTSSTSSSSSTSTSSTSSSSSTSTTSTSTSTTSSSSSTSTTSSSSSSSSSTSTTSTSTSSTSSSSSTSTTSSSTSTTSSSSSTSTTSSSTSTSTTSTSTSSSSTSTTSSSSSTSTTTTLYPGCGNFLTNPSFETPSAGNGTVPDDWTAFNTSGTQTYKGNANDWSYDGYQSYKITATSDTDTGIRATVSGLNLGQPISLSAYIKTDASVSNASITLDTTQNGLGGALTETTSVGANNNGFALIENFVSDVTSVNIFIGLGAFGSASDGTVWFDAIKLEVGSATTTYCPIYTTTSTSTSTTSTSTTSSSTSTTSSSTSTTSSSSSTSTSTTSTSTSTSSTSSSSSSTSTTSSSSSSTSTTSSSSSTSTTMTVAYQGSITLGGVDKPSFTLHSDNRSLNLYSNGDLSFSVEKDITGIVIGGNDKPELKINKE